MGNTVLHIGYPKAGSTFLQAYFSAHPEVFYSGDVLEDYKVTGKIPNGLAGKCPTDKQFVISEEQLTVWQGNLDIVGVKFQPFDIKKQQAEVCAQLHGRFPNAKVLIVTRGFESALSAMYSQYVSIGGIYSFESFLSEYAPIMAEFYDYNYLIDLYRQTFGAHNVVVLPFELMKHSRADFMRLMEEMLGITHFEFEAGRSNVSLEAEEAESYRKLSATIYAMVSILPYKLRRFVYGLYVYMLYRRALHGFVKLFRSKTEQLHVPPSVLALFSTRGNCLKYETIFEPYLKEYLI